MRNIDTGSAKAGSEGQLFRNPGVSSRSEVRYQSSNSINTSRELSVIPLLFSLAYYSCSHMTEARNISDRKLRTSNASAEMV
jgi:hypothetical protein